MSEAIKTIKIKIVNPNKGKKDALYLTVSYLNRVLETYQSLTLQHQELFQIEKESLNKKTGEVRKRKLSNSEILTFLEKLSLPTKAHPHTEININEHVHEDNICIP